MNELCLTHEWVMSQELSEYTLLRPGVEWARTDKK